MCRGVNWCLKVLFFLMYFWYFLKVVVLIIVNLLCVNFGFKRFVIFVELFFGLRRMWILLMKRIVFCFCFFKLLIIFLILFLIFFLYEVLVIKVLRFSFRILVFWRKVGIELVMIFWVKFLISVVFLMLGLLMMMMFGLVWWFKILYSLVIFLFWLIIGLNCFVLVFVVLLL